MELNSLKHVELLRKGIYAKQLQHYSNLCKIYEEILKSESIDINYISNAEIERALEKYAPLLNAASKGDYSYLKSHTLSRESIDIFKRFAYHTAKLEQFKTADSLLKDVIDIDAKTQKPMLSTTNLNKFKDFMREPLECETNPEQKPIFCKTSKDNDNLLNVCNASKFLNLAIGSPNSKFKYGHSPRWLGHTFFKMSKNSLDLIRSIDPSHLPNTLQIADKLTPASFGAEITGVKGNIQKFVERFQRKDKTTEIDSESIENYDPFTEKEQDYFKKNPGNIRETLYNQVVKAQKGGLKKVIAGALAITAFVTGISMSLPSIATTRDFDAAVEVAKVQMSDYTTPMSIYQLNSVIDDFENKNYTNHSALKEDANYSLDAIQQTCQTYLNQYDLPTVDELKSILNNLDDVTSLLIEKPVELAYQQRYPNFSNFKADLYYNDTITDYKDLNKTTTEEGVKVTAINPDGKEISTEIPNIGTPLGATDLFKRVLKQERNYDKDFDTLFTALSDPNTINPNTGKTYTYSEIRDLCNQFFSDIMHNCEIARTLTVPDVVIQKDGTFKFVITEQEKGEDTPDLEPSASAGVHSTDEGPELD